MIPCTWCSGKTQHDAIVGRPLPCLNQARDLRGDVGVGCDHALGPARGAAGVENHGAPLAGDVRQFRRLAGENLVARQRRECHVPRQSAPAGSPPERRTPVSMPCVSSMKYSSSDLGELSGNGTATPPARQMPHCTATHGNPGVTRNATRSSSKVLAASEQRRRHARRRIQQIVVGERSPANRQQPCVRHAARHEQLAGDGWCG